jgi:hypothetical protein
VNPQRVRISEIWYKPLSKATNVPIDPSYADQEYAVLAQALREEKYQGKLIVVCWHHGNIPNLLHAIQAPDGQYPDPWKRDVFNLILRVILDGSPIPAVSPITEPF